MQTFLPPLCLNPSFKARLTGYFNSTRTFQLLVVLSTLVMRPLDCQVNLNALLHWVGLLVIISDIHADNTSTEGDIAFHSQRRYFQQTAARAGVKNWGYLFTQPQPSIPALYGGKNFYNIIY